FDFKRNGCSPSSGNPVRLQPKSVFGFAEIRTLANYWPAVSADCPPAGPKSRAAIAALDKGA
ncbi:MULTISPECIES: hypothetical protein, partial [unclassified Burkholderia]